MGKIPRFILIACAVSAALIIVAHLVGITNPSTIAGGVVGGIMALMLRTFRGKK